MGKIIIRKKIEKKIIKIIFGPECFDLKIAPMGSRLFLLISDFCGMGSSPDVSVTVSKQSVLPDFDLIPPNCITSGLEPWTWKSVGGTPLFMYMVYEMTRLSRKVNRHFGFICVFLNALSRNRAGGELSTVPCRNYLIAHAERKARGWKRSIAYQIHAC